MIITAIVFKLNFQTFLHIIHLEKLKLRIGNVLIGIIINLLYGHHNSISLYICASSACGVSVEHMNAKKTNGEKHISISRLLSYQKNIKNT